MVKRKANKKLVESKEGIDNCIPLFAIFSIQASALASLALRLGSSMPLVHLPT